MTACLYCGDKIGVIKILKYLPVNSTMLSDRGRQVYQSVWGCKKNSEFKCVGITRISSYKPSCF